MFCLEAMSTCRWVIIFLIRMAFLLSGGIMTWNAQPLILRILRPFLFTLRIWSLLSYTNCVSRRGVRRGTNESSCRPTSGAHGSFGSARSQSQIRRRGE
jgi:hypothetical protein